MNTFKTDILIIGAGLTGLTLAYYLKDLNISFKITEARPTIGGRIKTKYNTNQAPIELGATWLIEQQVAAIKLLKELNIPVFKQYYGKTAIYQPNQMQAAQLVKLPENNALSYRVEDGTYSVIKALAKKLPENSIDCNQSVQSIKTHNGGLEIEATTYKHHCKHVIATLPPSLFSKTITTEPSLSKDIKQLMLNTHTWMQDSIRVGITYKNAFWQNKNTSGTIYSSAGPIQEFYDHSNANNSLFALSGFINSKSSDYTRDQRKALIIKQLQTFYGDQALEYDSYEECVWKDEKQTLVGNETFLMPQTNNGHPLYQNTYLNNRLFIAGAETSPVFSGKMEGAITSAQFVFKKLKTIYYK